MSLLTLKNNNMSEKDMQQTILETLQKINPIDPMKYITDLIKPYSIDKLNEKISKCTKCEIGKENISKSLLYGNSFAEILVIFDYVSNGLDINMEHLQDIFKSWEIDINKFAFCNAVNCYPYSDKNKARLPTKKEICCCYENIVQDIIRIIQPKVLIIVGNTALKAFSNYSFASVRGQMVEIMNIPTMVTYSPSYFEKMSSIKNKDTLELEYNDFLNDLRTAIEYFYNIT